MTATTRPAKRKTYTQGRRDERAAIAKAMRPRERIVAKAKFEHLKIDGRAFSGRGMIELYEDVFKGMGFSSGFEMPGLGSWRVKMAPRGLSLEDKKFVFALMGKTVELIFEPDGPNRCCGQAGLISMTAKGPHHWRFEGFGKLTMELKEPAPLSEIVP